jgi:hypothetical protein
MKRIKPNYFTAVHALVGGGVSGPCVDGSISEYVFSEGQTPPTESAIQTELSRQLAEDDAQDYARKRKEAYPDIYDYMDGIVKNDQTQIDKYIADSQAVKARYKKG